MENPGHNIIVNMDGGVGGSWKVEEPKNNDDWRYEEDRLKLRGEVLKILLSKFGGPMEGCVPKYSTQSIYECAHDWVSQGNKTSFGIVKYFEAYYAKMDS
jgi:hypothetical protein